jgi:predicted metalloendopeptidase
MSKSTIAAVLLATSALFAGPIACTSAEDAEFHGTELGIDPGWMDQSVKPGDDFFLYANGTWVAENEIPADRSSIGGFWMAFVETEANLKSLIEEIAASDPEPGSAEERIKNFYLAYLDTEAIDAAGMAPIQADLDGFAAIESKEDLAAVLGSQTRADVDPLNVTDYTTSNLFGVFVTQALKGGEVVPYILQGGLGMPEREYYLSSSERMADHRAAYRKYVADLLGAAGYADATAMAARVYDLEVKIARAHATREQTDDWKRATQLWSKRDFASKAPGLDWGAYFKGAGLDGFDTFNAFHPQAIGRLAALVESEPLQAWKDWLIFHQIDSNSDILPSQLDALSFGFYATQLSGTEEQRTREKRAISALNNHLGDEVGKLYVEKFFPASAKSEIATMVDDIKQAFARRIEAIDWMDPATNEEAIKKATTMAVGVGYPDQWTDYSELSVGSGTPYANRQAAEKLYYRQQLARVGQPKDSRAWWMNAQIVNAVNLPVQNAMNFPAGILQPPFYSATADPAYNFGAIGAVIGHEISHSFDDNGADFDAEGAMRNWWTSADKAKFAEAGDALAAQYDQYRPFPDLAVNGRLTLGENIADVAGLAAAYDAYRASLGGKEAPVIDGFTGDQRFFIAYAQAWATKMREAAMRQRIATDGHAPGNYRALTVRNIDAWYAAFGVKEGDALYLAPEERVKVW